MCFRLFLYIYGNKLQTLVDDSYTVVIFSLFVTSRDDLFLSIVAIRFTVNDFFGVRGQVTERDVAGRETLVIQQREYSRKFVSRCACSRYFITGVRTEKNTNSIECRERVKRHVDVTNRDIHVGWVRSVSHFRRIYARFTNKILPSHNIWHEARSTRCDSANLFSLPAILVIRVCLAALNFWKLISYRTYLYIEKYSHSLLNYRSDKARRTRKQDRIGQTSRKWAKVVVIRYTLVLRIIRAFILLVVGLNV